MVGGTLEAIFPTTLPFLPTIVQMTLGLIVTAGGFGSMGLANQTFKRLATNVPTFLPATMMVCSGLYRVSRNPMYLGGSVFFLGVAITADSLWLLAAYIPLGLFISLFVIPREEAYMKRAFSTEYEQYCRQVRRWI